MSSGEPVRNDYGVVQYDEVTETVTGAAVWSESSTEFDQNQERTNEVCLVVIQSDVDLSAIDAIHWNGRKWEVQGNPMPFQTPFGGIGNGAFGGKLQQFRMNRVEG